VIGITRRGFVPSSQPGSGYDVATRARDDVAVLDALGIDRAVFVGHSVAGSELTALGLHHSSRVESLVYLDAYDLSRRFELADIPPAPFTERDGDSLSLYQAASQRYDDTLRPDHAVCIGVGFARKGSIAGSTTPPSIPGDILRGVQEPQSQPVDWAKVTVPRLGIFGSPSVTGRLPYYWYLDAAGQAAFDAAWPAIVQWYADRIDDFAVVHAGTPAPVAYTLPGDRALVMPMRARRRQRVSVGCVRDGCYRLDISTIARYFMRTPSWRLAGREPDYRFSLANERTFLAWIRTALSMLAGGVLLEQFATRLEPRLVVVGLAIGLAVLSTVLCGVAYFRWKANEIAMRHDQPLPSTIAIPLLALAAAIVSAIIAAVEWLR
jgi:putative membrane protein